MNTRSLRAVFTALVALVLATGCTTGDPKKWKTYNGGGFPSGTVACGNDAAHRVGTTVWENIAQDPDKALPGDIEITYAGTTICKAYLSIDGTRDNASAVGATGKRVRVNVPKDLGVICRGEGGATSCTWMIGGVGTAPKELRAGESIGRTHDEKTTACNGAIAVWDWSDHDYKKRPCNVTITWKSTTACDAKLAITWADGKTDDYKVAKGGASRFATFIGVKHIDLKCTGGTAAAEKCSAQVIQVERPPD